MSRSTFGGTSVDWLVEPYQFGTHTLLALRTSTTVLSFWSAFSGGSQYTDLLNASATPVTTISALGHQVPNFQGPDGILAMWADKGDGSPRELLEAQDLAGAASAVTSAQAARDAAIAAVSAIVGPAPTGLGAAADTSAINTFIAGHPGQSIILRGSYQLKADLGAGADHGGGITLNQAGTSLMCYGATFTMATTTQAHYQMVDITAADCGIYGGKWVGDVGAHTGTGEWGHGIAVAGGADRCRIQDTYVTRCWGDGYLIWEDPVDVSFVNCIAFDNRRQGLSMLDATRPRVTGGAYGSTGLTAYTAPGGGIGIEPDPATTRDVVDAVISGATMVANKGPGCYVSANGRTATGEVIGCRTVGSTDASWGYGFRAIGATGFRFTSCRAENCTLDGFASDTSSVDTTFQSCEAKGNRFGFQLASTRDRMLSCSSSSNNRDGISIQASAVDAQIVGGSTSGNSQLTTGTYQNIDNSGVGTKIMGHATHAGTATNKPNYGVVNRSGATGTQVLNCAPSGSFVGGQFIDQETTTPAVFSPGSSIPAGKPTAAAGANSGTSPPAPVVNTASRTLRGSITFGTGTTPAAGAQLVVTFASALTATPTVAAVARNSATAALGLYISAASTSAFTVSTTSAPTASQANTVYSIDYLISV